MTYFTFTSLKAWSDWGWFFFFLVLFWFDEKKVGVMLHAMLGGFLMMRWDGIQLLLCRLVTMFGCFRPRGKLINQCACVSRLPRNYLDLIFATFLPPSPPPSRTRISKSHVRLPWISRLSHAIYFFFFSHFANLSFCSCCCLSTQGGLSGVVRPPPPRKKSYKKF